MVSLISDIQSVETTELGQIIIHNVQILSVELTAFPDQLMAATTVSIVFILH